MVNRRSAIRHLFCISAGTLVLPSCLQDKSKSAILLKNLQIDAGQEKLLEELAETIIPAGSTPGAKDIYAHLFVLKMLDDCYVKDDRQRFVRGMEQFQKKTKNEFDKSFVEATPAQRQSLLNKIEADKEAKDDLSWFYGTTKKLTIQAYTTSEFYLTKIHVYEMVPGRYHGCVPVKSLNSKPS
ncbi:MAG: gluconate 2-dehydrogenase subunit 3 family protein [Chitinophagaceae bacterium]|nr:gluconate 2-dehydrogenase subunit 3 family protein [Chitinophagaceae bacterium]